MSAIDSPGNFEFLLHLLVDYRNRIQHIAENIDHGFIEIDKGGAITYINQQATHIFYQSLPEEPLGKRIDMVLSEPILSFFQEGFQDASAWNQPIKRETHLPNEDRWVETHIIPTIYGFSVFVSDISERKKMIGALKEREKRLRSIVDSITDHAVFMVDSKGTIISWNKGALNLFEYTESEILGKNMSVLYTEDDRKMHFPYEEFINAVKNNIFRTTRWQIRKDGSRFWADICTVVLRDLEGNIHGYTKIVRDLTETSRFIEIATHELRNPLAAITSVVDLIQRRINNNGAVDSIEHQVKVLRKEVDRLSSLLNEIFESFRANGGHLPFKVERIDLRDLVAESLTTFQAAFGSSRFHVEKAPCPIWVLGDYVQLLQAFRNLISNAVKYSYANSPITVRFAQSEQSVQIQVEDRGIGILEGELERIFDIFFRGSNLSSLDPGGMGLGLHICKNTITRHQGRIWAKNNEPKPGTTFFVELPVLSSI